MKIALVADLHGNMTAVRRLEQDLARRAADEIWCLGDMVGKGPRSDLTFDWAMANCSLILRGNWDDGLGRRTFLRDAFYHAQLGDKRLEILKSLPLEKHLTLSGRRIRLMHGRPVMRELKFIHSPQAELDALFTPHFQVVGYADVHRQGLRTLDHKMLFNTGSVGNSLGVTHIQYAIMEGSPRDAGAPLDFTFVNLPYDRNEAVREVLAAPGLPYPDEFISEIETGVYARAFMHKKPPEHP